MSLFVSLMAYLFAVSAVIISLYPKLLEHKYINVIRVTIWIGLIVFGTWDIFNRFRSSQQIPFARVDWAVTGTEINPKLIKSPQGDSVKFKLGNFGTGDAVDITSSVFYVYIKGGILIRQGLPVVYMKTPYQKFSPNFILGYELNSTYKDASIDSTFACIKIDYSDSTQTRKAFNRILRMNYHNGVFSNVSNDIYLRIKNYLISNNIWMEPFER